jgi:hypothetical protein
MNSDAFALSRIVFVFNEDETAETRPFREPGWAGHRTFEFWDEFDDVRV